MENNKIYLEDMSSAELRQIMEHNSKLYYELREGADEADTRWAINDFFRDSPRALDEDSYNRIYVSRPYVLEDVGEVLEWIQTLDKDGRIYDLDADEISKAIKYLDVLRDDDCGYICMKDQDREYLNKAVNNALHTGLAAVQEEYDNIRNQFDDLDYLIDMLQSTGWLEGSGYYVQDGKVYQDDTRLVA